MRKTVQIPVAIYDKFVGQKLARERGTTLPSLVESLIRREVVTTFGTGTGPTRRQKAS